MQGPVPGKVAFLSAPMTPDPSGRSDLVDGGRLLQLLGGRPLEGFERSFKMTHGSLLSNRYLMGLSRRRFPGAWIAEVCRRIEMPVDYLAAFEVQLPRADAIHFGFEQGERSSIYKAYLEFTHALRGSQGSAKEVILLHLAYKWEIRGDVRGDVRNPGRRTIARYECHPGLSNDAALARLARLFGPGKQAPVSAVEEMVTFASARTSEPFMYLEVSEDNNPRASFDINLHAAELRVKDIEPMLLRLQSHYAIPAGPFAELLERVRGEKLGHISGGKSRDGADFMTVYHEVQGRRHGAR